MNIHLLSKKIFCFIILITVLSFTESGAQGFLKRDGKRIINGTGQEILLKGIGLGGWLLQEGYMLHTSSFANAQWQIREKIRNLVGESNTELFYNAYRANYVKRVDIEAIKQWGFNSIRLPFHYNLFLENGIGYGIVDSLLSWCEDNQIYLILDMHAAPGGQSNENISDYNPAFPSLWESSSNKDLAVWVWRKLAERYKDEPWIGGYDLLNEPKWNLPPNNQPLRDLYIRMTDTIRAVDTNHIVFIEGNWYATDFSGLTPPWDENMVYSFHRYWNPNTQPTIQYLVDLKNNFNIPLWLGETGENSNQWFVDCVNLMRTNNIGWAWWPHKKIKSIAGPLSAPLTSGYQVLLNYWNGQGPQPTVEFAMNALMGQAEKLKFENCRYQKDVIDALIRQPFNNSLVQYAENSVPGIIQASDYDMGKQGYAYFDNDFQNTGGGSWNQGNSYRNDGVDIEPCNDMFSNGFNVGYIEHGEWINYTIHAAQSGLFRFTFNVASTGTGGKIMGRIDGNDVTGFLEVPNTGGWQNWQGISKSDIYLSAGTHSLKLTFLNGSFNLSYIDAEQTFVDVNNENNPVRDFSVSQNYPNPFNPFTNIKYNIPERGTAVISLYSPLGEKISDIFDGEVNAGEHTFSFDASSLNLSSGIFYYQVIYNGTQSIVKKLVLLK